MQVMVVQLPIGANNYEYGKEQPSDLSPYFINLYTLFININEKFVGERGRINCSLRDPSGFWRWLGVQFVVSDK